MYWPASEGLLCEEFWQWTEKYGLSILKMTAADYSGIKNSMVYLSRTYRGCVGTCNANAALKERK